MDSDGLWRIAVLAVLLALSAFFSASETSLTTVSRHAIRAKADDGDKKAKKVVKLLSNEDKMLSAILICNNIVNITASSISTTLAINIAASLGASRQQGTIIGLATLIITFLILEFGEITPKNVAVRNNEKLSLRFGPVILPICTVLTPVIFIVNAISKGLSRLLGVHADNTPSITEGELLAMVDAGEEEGVIEQEEKEIIQNVFDFGDHVVREIMIPRVDMQFAYIGMGFRPLMDAFEEKKYSKLPVYEDSPDEVVGIIYLKDLFFQAEKYGREGIKIKDIMRKPLFTYEYRKISELLTEMREKSVSMAIVLDEYGTTEGLITMEDIIEELVGDIRDEFDDDEEIELQKVGENEYVIIGSMPIDDLNDELGTRVESEDFDSVGGHVIELLGDLAKEGDEVEEDGITYRVEKMDRNRIERVRVKIDEDYFKEDE